MRRGAGRGCARLLIPRTPEAGVSIDTCCLSPLRPPREEEEGKDETFITKHLFFLGHIRCRVKGKALAGKLFTKKNAAIK